MRTGRLLLMAIVVSGGLLDAAGIESVADPVSDAARVLFPEHRQHILAAFAAMPEEKYTFRPTPELMTFGELAVHIASANTYYCRRLGGAAPTFARPKATAPKKALVELLEQALDYCAPVIAATKDGSLGEPAAPIGSAPPSTRARELLELLSGMDHHYAQAAGYLRLNGILPPTASGKQD